MPALAGIDSVGAILHNSAPAVAAVRRRAAIPVAVILQLDKVAWRAN
ncbi:MAG: hypothetical protein ACNA8G_07755 [Gammaproteobacteria bacterium]